MADQNSGFRFFETGADGSSINTSLGSILGGLFSTDGLGNLVEGISGYMGLEEQQQLARQLGPAVQAQAEALAGRAGELAEFQPFTITGAPGLGTAQITQEGIGLTTGAPQQRITEQALAGAETALAGLLAPRAQREAQLLAELEAARAPMRERERLAEELRLAAQGRLGTQSMMYGGMTPEEFQRRSLIEEQRARDVLAARTQVGQEQAQTQQLLSGLLGTAYTPQAQAINLLGAATAPAQLRQAAALSGSEALQAAISPVAQATAKGEQLAADYAAAQLAGLTGLLAPSIQTAGQALGTSDIARGIGEAVESGLGDLYSQIFG